MVRAILSLLFDEDKDQPNFIVLYGSADGLVKVPAYQFPVKRVGLSKIISKTS